MPGPLQQQGSDVDADALARRILQLEYLSQYPAVIGGTINGVSVAQIYSAAQGPGRKWAFMGDSLTGGFAGLGGTYHELCFAMQSLYMAGSLHNSTLNSINAGVDGQNSTQIVARIPANITAGAQGIVLLAGTNDASQAVSVSVYIANMTQAITYARTAGLPIIIATVPPQASPAVTAAVRKKIEAYNFWIRFTAPQLGATVADIHAALVDQTSGDLAAAYAFSDGTHWLQEGHRQAAMKVAAAMNAVEGTRYPLVTGVSAGNFVANPLMAGTSPFATGWSEAAGGTGTAPTYTVAADSSGFLKAGQWQQMAFNATSGGTRTMNVAVPGTGLSGGFDTVAITGKLQIVDTGGNLPASIAANTASIKLQLTDQSGTLLTQGEWSVGQAGTGVYNLGPSFARAICGPSNTSFIVRVVVTLPAGANVTVRVGELGVFSISALGMDGLLVL